MIKRPLTFLALSILVAALAACGIVGEPAPTQTPVTPVLVYITPTPVPPVIIYVTPTPGESTAIAARPTGTPTPEPSPTSPPSLTPLPTGAPGAVFGPIVGPNHTLIPTETRLPPTAVPTAIPTAGPSPTPLPGLRRDLMGVQIHPHVSNTEFNDLLARTADLGLAWVKFQFNWSLLESAPGHYTELFYMMRLYVQQAHNQGFKVMISVAKAPGWSRSTDADGQMRENGPPNDPQMLANFLAGMLNQIGMDAAGRPYVDAVEVWNEANLQREWYGRPLTGEDYMRYFRPAYDAIRRFSPGIVIITAAPAPTGDSHWSTDDRTWLQQLYNGGLAQYGADVAVGIHPYGWANAPDARCCSASRGWDDKPQFFFLDTIEDYRRIMVANGHSAAQLWTTEFGWATFEGLRTSEGKQPADPPDAPYFAHINQAQQANYTVRAFELAQERSYMGPMILWNLNFATLGGAVDQADAKAGYGLLDSFWQPRPVYQVLKQVPKQ